MRIDDLAAFVAYFDRVRDRTLEMVDRIPPDAIEWTYAEGKFSFGDTLRHLAGLERYMFVENALGRPSAYAGHGRELADGYSAVRAYMRRLHEESNELLFTLTPERLQEKCLTPAGTPITVWKWLRAMVEHEVHHRGQLYVYLGLLGIENQRLYGLTAEEVAERSRPLGADDGD